MQEDFLNRGYPNELESDTAKRAYWKNRQELLQTRVAEGTF